MYIESYEIMYEEEYWPFPKLLISVGGGVNVNIANDKALFAEFNLQGADLAALASSIVGTRISF